MPDAPIAHKPRCRFDNIEDSAVPTPSLADRLTLRSHELARVLGLSRSTLHSYISRGIAPPSISTPSGHATLFVVATVRDWLARSEAAGRLLERSEYAAAVAADETERRERKAQCNFSPVTKQKGFKDGQT